MLYQNTITVEDAVKICKGKLICGNKNTVLENFCENTKKIQEGDVYIGLKGSKRNGGEFYEEAFQKGAKACIVQDMTFSKQEQEKYKDKAIILVDDALIALQELAKYKRSLYDIPVIAITGSVGKTSTKDIVASVMSKKYNVLKTEGNYNGQIGAPLTVLRLKDHNAMVIELGMSEKGELSKLTQIVKPTVAVITNIGTSHIGNLGSRKNILKAKLEILEGLKPEGKIVINNDNDMLHNWNQTGEKQHEIVTYGIQNESNVMAKNINLTENSSSYEIALKGETYPAHIEIPGEHFVSNSLCAVAVGNIFNINIEDMLDGISHFELTKKRMQIEKINDQITVINDCYNANYDSMKAAIETLSTQKDCKKIAVLGDMLELGKYTEELHRKVGQEVVKNKIDYLITVGKSSKYIADEAIKRGMNIKSIHTLENNLDVVPVLKMISKEKVSILIKASNGMKFQEIFDDIKAKM